MQDNVEADKESVEELARLTAEAEKRRRALELKVSAGVPDFITSIRKTLARMLLTQLICLTGRLMATS